MSLYMVVAQHDPDIFSKYIMPGLERWGIDVAISMNVNPEKEESIFLKYNDGIKKFLGCTDIPIVADDVIGFCHEDVKIIDPFFVQKVETVFKERGDIGLCGVVGATELKDSCAWWHNKPEQMRGHIIQENGDKAIHMPKGGVGFFDDLVAVDGLCFFIRASLLMDGMRFDNETYNGFDFYDIDTCVQVLERGFRIGCADILLQHKSIGDVSKKKSWHENKNRFIEKWKNKGFEFPFTQKTFIKENIETIEV